MKIKNFISYTRYGFINKKFNGAVLFTDIAILVYGVISFIKEPKPASFVVLFLSVFMNIIWQAYSALHDLLEYYSKNGLEEYIFPSESIDFSRFIDEREGLEVIRTSHGTAGINRQLNEWIRNNDLNVEEDTDATVVVNTYIEKNFYALLPFLTRHYRRTVAEDRLFSNDEKLCFSDDFIDKDLFLVSKGSYYNSFLTNRIFNQKLVSDDGVDLFPAKGCTSMDIKFPYRCFSNEIGISTLAVTKDGYLFFQLQGNHSDSSPGLIVPSGSGSADWSDFDNNRTLTFKELISYSTKRELSEETGSAMAEVTVNKVIGFYRWLEQAGKPEFISVSKLNMDSKEIQPEKKEQQNKIIKFRVVSNGKLNEKALTDCFEYLSDPNLSLPLYMCLMYLKDFYDNDPESLAKIFI